VLLHVSGLQVEEAVASHQLPVTGVYISECQLFVKDSEVQGPANWRPVTGNSF